MTGFWKVFAATALVVAVTLTAMGMLVMQRVSTLADEQTRRLLVADTAMLAATVGPALLAAHASRTGSAGGADGAGPPPPSALSGAGTDVLQAQLAQAARLAPGRRLTLIEADGTVVADTDENPADMDNHAERPEIVAARQPHEPVLRHSRTVGRQMLYYALPVESSDGTLLGYARVSVQAADLAAEQAHLRSALLLSAAVALALGAAAALLLARGIHVPLQRITDFVGAVARGERVARLSRSGQGDLSGLAAAVNSMTDQLDARFERIMRDQSELLAVLSSMVEGVLAVDQEQRVVLLNAAAARMLDVGATAVRGRPVWEVTRIPEVTGILGRCLSANQLEVGEVVLAGDPHDRVLRLTAAPLSDEAGAWGCVLVLHDLTDVRRLENVRRDFVVNVSHELKTPLTVMRGFVEAVLDEPAMDDRTRQRFLIRARENTDRMVGIVSDLLTLARIEAEDGALHPDELDLREIATRCHSEATSAAAIHGISLQLDMPGRPVPVFGDPAALRSALTNLIDNAIKYSPRGGRVRLRVDSSGEEAFVEVADRGPGIPAHETGRIFERFYRVDRNRSRELGGTGLGLAIVRHVALAHRGRVGVESTPGLGSSFRLTLPLRPPDAGGGTTTVPDAPRACGTGPAETAPPEAATLPTPAQPPAEAP